MVSSFHLFAVEKLKKHIDKSELGDLDKILKQRYLRVLTTRNPYDYYMSDGKAKGIQYEMVKEFVNYLNKRYTKKGELRIVFEMVPVDFEDLIPMLNAGKGDLIAVGMTKTAKREKLVSFTKPYRKVDDVIVTRKDLSQMSWARKTFHVQKNSSYHKELLKNKNLVKVETVSPNFHPGDMLELISIGKYDYSLVNSFWAKTISKAFGNLVVLKDPAFRKNVEISWAVRKNNPQLLKIVNRFLPKVRRGTLLGNLFSYKYFHDIGRIFTADANLKSNTISKYDKYFKKYGEKYGFDWRLLAALCYQESRFEPAIKNKWGAIGLFQIKQKTANEPYVKIKDIEGVNNIENNIHAGVKYLAWIRDRYFTKNKDMSEESKLRMTLAAYNAGPRRVLQAIEKAKVIGLDPNRWFRNVELGMLKRGYPEPVFYVSEINKHYVSYLLLGIK